MQSESSPTSLPISDYLETIGSAFQKHSVILVCGATGSGKTTQLPQLCFHLRQGLPGIVGHTQPRRLAARRVAQRIAQEMQMTLGSGVGLQTRFDQRYGPETRIKLMTEGILLNELKHDPTLRQYHTLILDEVHERSLNVDFLMGYLKRLLLTRTDLKVILTSASLASESLSQFFDHAPILTIPGKSFPVKIEYRPFAHPTEGKDTGSPLSQALIENIVYLDRMSRPEDILIFLTGEPEIGWVKPPLTECFPNSLVLPLYARQSPEQQRLVFQSTQKRKLILATNVAETSLTIPSVRHVIDTGRARISRYLPKSRIQALRIEPICQASAIQRAGRCGRLAPGVCIRLYEEMDYLARPAFLSPEIRRTHLSALLLRMGDLHLGSPKQFDFLDKPDHRRLQEALTLLKLLEAVPTQQALHDPIMLTTYGRRLAKLPLDPTLGAMVLEGLQHNVGYESAVIATLLSIEDPCLWPKEKREKIAAIRAPWQHPRSDFLTYLKFWEVLQTARANRTRQGFAQFCTDHFFNFNVVRQWQMMVEQLIESFPALSATAEGCHPSPIEKIEMLLNHCLMRALFWSLAIWDRKTSAYLGTAGSRFVLHPKSVLAKKQPLYLLAAHRIQTDKIWGCMAAALDPRAIETALSKHFIWRYGEPYWDEKAQTVLAKAHASLFGLPLVTNRRCHYGKVDLLFSKRLWLTMTFLNLEWGTSYPFLLSNRKLLRQLQDLCDKLRHDRWQISASEQLEWYTNCLPERVADTIQFQKWYRKEKGVDDRLRFENDPAWIKRSQTAQVAASCYPDYWELSEGKTAKMTYCFAPGEPEDGLTVHFSTDDDGRAAGPKLSWHLPPYRSELIVQLLNTLPKRIRSCFSGGVAHIAQSFLTWSQPKQGYLSITQALTQFLLQRLGHPICAKAWAWDKVDTYLQIKCACPRGTRPIHDWQDEPALAMITPPTASFSPRPSPQMLSDTVIDLNTFAAKGWSAKGQLRCNRSACSSDSASSEPKFAQELQRIWRSLSPAQRTALLSFLQITDENRFFSSFQPGNSEGLFSSISPQWFQRAALPLTAGYYWQQLLTCTQWSHQLQKHRHHPGFQSRYPDLIHALQLWDEHRLRKPFFYAQVPWHYLQSYPRYFEALVVRMENYPRQPEKEMRFQTFAENLAPTLKFFQHEIGPQHPSFALAQEANWCYEEYHVQYFAQRLGTACTISEVRLRKIFAHVLQS